MTSHRGVPGLGFRRDLAALVRPGVRSIPFPNPLPDRLPFDAWCQRDTVASPSHPSISRLRLPVAVARLLERAAPSTTLSSQIRPEFTSHRGAPVMDDTRCCRFFLEPSCAPQRQYEALRAVFLDRCRQKDVAQRFGYDYAAFRQLVRQFRARCGDGQPPPFSAPRGRDRRPAPGPRRPPGPSARPSPTAAASAGPRGDACGHGSPASFSSCPCWPGCTSMPSCVRRATPARA